MTQSDPGMAHLEPMANAGNIPRSGQPPHPNSNAMPGLSPSPYDTGRPRRELRSEEPPGPWGETTTGWDNMSPSLGVGDPQPSFDRPPDPPQRPRLELAPAVRPQRSRTGLFAGLGVVGLLAVAAIWYFLIRQDDPASEFVADGAESAQEATDQAVEGAQDAVAPETEAPVDTTPVDPAAPTTLEGPPTIALQGGGGPLATEVPYTVDMSPVPADSQFVVIVDGQEQSDPIDFVPDLVLPEGRHSLVIRALHGGQAIESNSVEVYVLPPTPATGWRANLSSVDLVNEGWEEALRQFDEYRAANHENLVLTPSDPYPELLPGYWNIYVGGFPDRAAASAYCESFGLEVPADCFPSDFIGASAAPAEVPDSADTDAAESDASTEEPADGGAMEDAGDGTGTP